MTTPLHVLSIETLTNPRRGATFHALYNAPHLRHERDLDVLNMHDIQGSVITAIERHKAILNAWVPTNHANADLREYTLNMNQKIIEALYDYADDVPYTLSTLYLTYAHAGSDYGASFPSLAAATHFMKFMQRELRASALPYDDIPSIDDQPVQPLIDILNKHGWSLRCIVQPALKPFRAFPITASIPQPDNIPF